MKYKQQGVAIVLAMSIVALAALAATTMMVTQSTWSRHIELSNDHAQALLVSHGGLDWARAVLSDDSRASNVDYAGEPWAMNLPAIPVENGSLNGHIDDQQGKFNLNNTVKDGVVNLAQLDNFRRLLSTLALPIELADTLANWINNNQTLIDISDLTLVQGFDDDVRTRLRPFITALPKFTAVNVNTATPEVIAAIINGLTLDEARAITAQRQRSYFRTPADFFNIVPAGLIVANENISVNSHYFMVTLNTTIHDAQAQGSALLVRNDNAWPVIVWSRYL